MKASPTYRMKKHYLPVEKLEVGKSYVAAPNGQAYFTVTCALLNGFEVVYPKHIHKEYKTQIIGFNETMLYKEKKLKTA